MTGQQVLAAILEQVKRAGYYRYSSSVREVEVDGEKAEVELHRVGHNASHDFSIGLLPDGRLITMSVGEGMREGEIDRHVMVRGTAEEAVWPTYLGHY